MSRFVSSQPSGSVGLLDEDPALGLRMEARMVTQARAVASAPVRTIAPGVWEPRSDLGQTPHDFGALVLDGMLLRRVTVAGHHGVELLGKGDLMCPGQPERDEYAEVSHTVDWKVLSTTRVALIGSDLEARLVKLPGVMRELAARPMRRARSLALLLAIAQTRDLEERLTLVLWHLADRWGCRRSDGVVVSLPFGQETLAEIAAAKRASVCGALSRLERAGTISRSERGRLVLHGSPPTALPGPADARRGSCPVLA